MPNGMACGSCHRTSTRAPEATRSVGEPVWQRLVSEREHGPFGSLRNFCERVWLLKRLISDFMRAGLFDSLDHDRCRLLWELGVLHAMGAANYRSMCHSPTLRYRRCLNSMRSCWITSSSAYRHMATSCASIAPPSQRASVVTITQLSTLASSRRDRGGNGDSQKRGELFEVWLKDDG